MMVFWLFGQKVRYEMDDNNRVWQSEVLGEV